MCGDQSRREDEVGEKMELEREKMEIDLGSFL